VSDAPVAEESASPRSRRVAPLIVLVVALVIAGLFVVLIRGKASDAETAYSPLVGKPAPAVDTTTLDGQPFSLQRRKGSWVVLNFFNSTCGPCVEEHPELTRFAQEQQAKPDGAEFYSVVWDDKGGDTVDFFEKNPVTWPVLLDDTASITNAFAVTKVPETWIIDPNGYVVTHYISQLTDDRLTRCLNEQISVYAGNPPTNACN
jgi:cytochrome c biogenesis protein CcmG/thiol:disulfide interchange protein DsbE